MTFSFLRSFIFCAKSGTGFETGVGALALNAKLTLDPLVAVPLLLCSTEDDFAAREVGPSSSTLRFFGGLKGLSSSTELD